MNAEAKRETRGMVRTLRHLADTIEASDLSAREAAPWVLATLLRGMRVPDDAIVYFVEHLLGTGPEASAKVVN